MACVFSVVLSIILQISFESSRPFFCAHCWCRMCFVVAVTKTNAHCDLMLLVKRFGRASNSVNKRNRLTTLCFCGNENKQLVAWNLIFFGPNAFGVRKILLAAEQEKNEVENYFIIIAFCSNQQHLYLLCRFQHVWKCLVGILWNFWFTRFRVHKKNPSARLSGTRWVVHQTSKKETSRPQCLSADELVSTVEPLEFSTQYVWFKRCIRHIQV